MNFNLENPAGFYYFPEFISCEEEKFLIDQISKFNWEEVKMHGIVAKRRVVHFGLNYTYHSRTISPGNPPPIFLKPFIDRVAIQLNKKYDEIVEILVTEFPEGSGIGWHKDAFVFGDVFGISLYSPALFKLRRKKENKYQIHKFILAARSGYILSGEARSLWEHCISAVKQKRYSLTFRTLSEMKD